ncbi:MAG: tRNA (adenosine(37)-N6)-dimethylallyltransferase MiaA [Clostridia bacterium]|nr:tRNA (adenosine(37)-N6)-dimethylallyltransferase MiaA [Clostridia bacterium]
MTKVIIITGLTGSGKSGLGIKIAKEFNGEIISADSVQIYKGLDIGSAKEDKQTMSEICHHLIDIKEFNETFNVGEFIEETQKAIEKVISKGKLPIIVGGTGMYVKALLEGYSLGETSANEELRTKYQNMAKTEGNLAVWNELNKINPELANTVHPNNLKRVIRYIEISQNNQQPEKQESILSPYETLAIGIVADREEIYSKINKRVDLMLEMGLENEVKELIKKGATRHMQAFNSIGYKEWFDYFEGKIDYKTTIDLIKQHTRNYCKRQLTFLKTIKNINLCTIDDAEDKIRRFLND